MPRRHKNFLATHVMVPVLLRRFKKVLLFCPVLPTMFGIGETYMKWTDLALVLMKLTV